MKNQNFQAFQEYLRANGIFDKFGLKRIGVFGSYARDEKYNDIDLLLDENIDYEKRVQLKALLEDAFHAKVDVVIKQYAEPIILHRALKDMKYATKY